MYQLQATIQHTTAPLQTENLLHCSETVNILLS